MNRTMLSLPIDQVDLDSRVSELVQLGQVLAFVEGQIFVEQLLASLVKFHAEEATLAPTNKQLAKHRQ